MHIIHKWVVVASSPKWNMEICSRCGKERWVEMFKGGYQPRPKGLMKSEQSS